MFVIIANITSSHGHTSVKLSSKGPHVTQSEAAAVGTSRKARQQQSVRHAALGGIWQTKTGWRCGRGRLEGSSGFFRVLLWTRPRPMLAKSVSEHGMDKCLPNVKPLRTYDGALAPSSIKRQPTWAPTRVRVWGGRGSAASRAGGASQPLAPHRVYGLGAASHTTFCYS